MAKHKVSELSGGILDVAVALALGMKVAPSLSEPGWWLVFNPARGGWDTIMAEAPDEMDRTVWSPSGKWEHGGPLIHRDRIELGYTGDGEWAAACNPDASESFCLTWHEGQTPLTAAMRAYVASKLGDVVDLP